MNVDQKTVQPGDRAGDDADPGTKQDAAGHHRDHPHVQQRAVDVNARPGAEKRKQRKNGNNGRFLQRRMFIFLQQLAEKPGAGQEEEADQHQGGAVKHRQQHIEVRDHSQPSGHNRERPMIKNVIAMRQCAKRVSASFMLWINFHG